MAHVLLVEDEEATRLNYCELLTEAGFDVTACATAAQARAALDREPPDVALLDLNLEAERDEGFGLCVHLRSRMPGLPVVFLTRDDRVESQIAGFRLGADDYIIKDLHSLDLVVVRINALLRRSANTGPDTTPGGAAEPVECGSLTISRPDYKVYWRGAEVDLTLTRAWLVEALASAPGTVRSADELMREARLHVSANAIAKHISAIRREFERVDAGFSCITTERARGYRWIADRRD